MRWYIFGTDFFVCDCEKLNIHGMYIEFFSKKQAGKDVPKMRRRINQWFLNLFMRININPIDKPRQIVYNMHRGRVPYSVRN